MASEALSSSEILVDGKNKQAQRKNYWNDLVNYYEKRNASLERRHDALAERVRIMELALPSVLMGAVVTANGFPMNGDSISTLCSDGDKMGTNKCDEPNTISNDKKE